MWERIKRFFGFGTTEPVAETASAPVHASLTEPALARVRPGDPVPRRFVMIATHSGSRRRPSRQTGD